MRRTIVTLVLAPIALFLIAETLLRLVGLGDPPLAVVDTELEYRLIPNASYNRWGNRIEINSYGFRAPEHTPLPVADELRVLLIGDSVVYGNHFLDQDETIAIQLSNFFSKAECQVRAIPIALSSWGPVNQLAALRRHGSFGAKHAAIIVSAHDLTDVPTHIPDLLPYRLSPPLGAIGDLVEAVTERLRAMEVDPEGSEMTVPYEIRVEMSLAALEQIVDRLHREEIDTVLIYNATDSERSGAIRSEREVLIEWAGSRGLETIDLTDDGRVSLNDHIHPDADGAAQIATRLHDFLVTRMSCVSH